VHEGYVMLAPIQPIVSTANQPTIQQCFSVGGVLLLRLGSYWVVSSGHWNLRPGALMGRMSSQVAGCRHSDIHTWERGRGQQHGVSCEIDPLPATV
jgi:hypothetical protein